MVGYALPHSRPWGGEHDDTSEKGVGGVAFAMATYVLSLAIVNLARAYRIIKKATSKKK